MYISLPFFLPDDIVHRILQYIGDDIDCQFPKKINQIFFPDESIRHIYKNEENQSLMVDYCKDFLLYRTVELCINVMRKEQYPNLPKKRKMNKKHIFFPRKTITYIEMFHNIISRSLFELEKKDNYIHSPDYQSQFQAIFNARHEDITHTLTFLSTNSTYTLLDTYYIRQCNVWINHILQEQIKQSGEKYWSKYLYRDLLRESKKRQKSLLYKPL
jgi:hypothetical protein